MAAFCALDVETAARECGSICQVGIAHFCNGSIIDSWVTLVDPETDVSPGHTRIHGIASHHLAGQPTFAEIWPEFQERTMDCPVASHTFFDRTALRAAAERYALPCPVMPWIDSCRLARRAWPHQRRQGGYSLRALAGMLDLRFRHHDALEDAIVAGRIVVAAAAELNVTIEVLARQACLEAGMSQDSYPDRSSQ